MPRTPSPELAREWRDRVCRFEQCGLTVAEFCQREGYSAASFYQWRRADKGVRSLFRVQLMC